MFVNLFLSQSCFSVEQLLRIHRLAATSASQGLGRAGLARLSPALLQQVLSGACAGATGTSSSDKLTQAESKCGNLLSSPQQRSGSVSSALVLFAEYLYATLANVVITLTAMFGIVVLLCTACTSVFQLCIQFCISLAVGSLTGDALLHLLPMVGTAEKCHV